MASEVKTKYRVTSNGYFYFLEYAAPRLKFNWLRFNYETRYYWTRVPKADYDFMDEIWKRFGDIGNENNHDKWICSSKDDFQSFINQYPNIEPYLLKYQKDQQSLINKVRMEMREQEQRKRYVRNI